MTYFVKNIEKNKKKTEKSSPTSENVLLLRK